MELSFTQCAFFLIAAANLILLCIQLLKTSDVEAFSSSHACNATIITAYYKIPSKRSHEEYLSFMENFLTIQDCLVVFTTPDQELTILALRPPAYPIIVIPTLIQSFLVSEIVSSSEWEKQEKMDNEQGIGHNRDLYSVWSEKTNMMKIVSDLNPYSSSYFIWLDIGAVRQPGYNHQQMVHKIPEEKGVLLLILEEFTEDEKTLTDGKSSADFSHLVRLGGGTIGAGKESLDLWHTAFYRTMKNYLEEGRFIGKDQNMMATTCLESDMCLLVPGGDPIQWFRMQPWLRGEVDENYTRLNVIHN
eukprot:TRINITY_DN12144_c0_g1_i5.p1 TRINITY_DN12144_c0_g1~~TRINITY_DN12144_c0_g1_i5.p1  ORF type:complete len:303 (+),score=59.94 TRINITY_DN12144_c0_g1_i5:45-953(+)